MKNMENTTNMNIKTENIIQNLNKIQANIQKEKEENNQEIILKENEKNEENKSNNEKIPLKHDEKLIIRLKNFYNKIRTADEQYYKIEEDYQNFFKNKQQKNFKIKTIFFLYHLYVYYRRNCSDY